MPTNDQEQRKWVIHSSCIDVLPVDRNDYLIRLREWIHVLVICELEKCGIILIQSANLDRYQSTPSDQS
jgi:hypothetical protein